MKDVENRKSMTAVRGWVTVHTGKRFDYEGYDWVARMFPAIRLPRTATFPLGGDIGRMLITDCVRSHHSKWFNGPCGYLIADSHPLPFAKRRGQLGFFRET